MASITDPTVQQNQPSSYDQQRKQIQDEERRRQQSQQDAMQRRLAGSGFKAGSGMLEAQQGRLGQALSQEEQARLSGVDVAQRQAEEQQANQLQLQSNEQQLTREQMAQQQAQFGSTLGLQERQQGASEQQFGQQFGLQQRAQTAEEQQFEAAQNLETWKTELAARQEQNRLAQEADIATKERAMQENLQYMRNSVEYQRMANEMGTEAADRALAWKMQEQTIGQQKADREAQYGFAYQQLYEQVIQANEKIGMEQAQLEQASRQFTDEMLWQKQQFESNLGWESERFYSDQKQQRSMATLGNQLANNTLTLQDSINDANESKKLMVQNMFARGAAGEVIDTTKMSPDQLNAYQAGLSGKSKEQYDQEVANQQALLNSMVINAATPEVVQRVMDIYSMFGYAPGYTSTTNTGGGSYAYQE
jgi:hypothetical protein